MQKKVIITDHVHPLLADRLREAHYIVDVEPEISNEELLRVIATYHGLVLSTRTQVTPSLLDKADNLEFIARAGSGMENIDVRYAESKNIKVVNAPEGNANAVAEHALGLLLCLLNNIAAADHDIRNGIWQREENRGIELQGKTVGIIGYGHTGSAFASKLTGLGVRILVYDKYKKNLAGQYIKQVALEILQAEADILSFHVPLTAETKYYFNTEFLNNCKKQIRLLNTSRGGVVDTAALLKGLDSEKVAGAALDVFENEKFYMLDEKHRGYFNELSKRRNVVMTPHVAGWTVESYIKISSILAEKILATGLS